MSNSKEEPAMPSPFPGMDPYLEDPKFWPLFHHQLVTSLYQGLLPGLVDRYRARVAQRHYATEQPLFTSVVHEDHHEEYIEILQRKDGGRLITLIDVVSPTNRVTEAGRQSYLHKRREARTAGANLVEVDLVLQGKPMREVSSVNHPDWDYAITVTRPTRPDRPELYTATLQKELPQFRIPFASDDYTMVDLRAIFLRTYDQAGLAGKVDYTQNPSVPLKPEDQRWLDQILRQQKLR
jgi:hypothetical protein